MNRDSAETGFISSHKLMDDLRSQSRGGKKTVTDARASTCLRGGIVGVCRSPFELGEADPHNARPSQTPLSRKRYIRRRSLFFWHRSLFYFSRAILYFSRTVTYFSAELLSKRDTSMPHTDASASYKRNAHTKNHHSAFSWANLFSR